MTSSKPHGRWPGPRFLVLAALCALPALLSTPVSSQTQIAVLRIGASGSLTGKTDSAKEKAGLKTLHRFLLEETGLENEIIGAKNWEELAGKMAKDELHLGVLQGYEFAWAQEKFPGLKPLAVGVNGERYPVAYILTSRSNAAREFVGLQGSALALPLTCHGFLRVFVEQQSEAAGKNHEAFFSKIISVDNVEDALDDVVDGTSQATVVDRAALEAYMRRKPGRYKQLREVARSQPFPPLVVAYHGSALDQATLQRFKDGLLNAVNKKKGETLLTLSRLTAFEAVPEDFGRVLAETRKAYPPGKK
jgi:ABC-type phosphate/phosphonate transport system substrate-binding protein